MAICLEEEHEDHIRAATAWAFGQIGRHTPEHARSVAVANVLPKLLHLYLDTESSEDLQVKVSSFTKYDVITDDVTIANVINGCLWFALHTHSKQAKKALKSILQKCTYLPVLEPLLYEAPSNILKHVICQFSKVMWHCFLDPHII